LQTLARIERSVQRVITYVIIGGEDLVVFMETMALSAIMGFSIYLSLPIILKKNQDERRVNFLTAIAVGILIFLIGDVFLDSAGTLYNGSLYGYGSSPTNDLVFTLAMVAGFGVLFMAGNRRKMVLTPTELALIIALGIAFQNLTEGLLFGALSVGIGLTGAALVVLVGFIFQNTTEGFPIASPFLGSTEGKGGVIAGALMIGGTPTILGGAVGYFYNAAIFDLVFYGLAIGTMLYVILPMLRHLLAKESSKLGVAYAGVFLGFVLGFAVNLL
jgi:zinc transporter, ZIP family